MLHKKFYRVPLIILNIFALCASIFAEYKSDEYIKLTRRNVIACDRSNKGRCFVLCTSYSMMRGLAEYFREKSNLSIYYKAKPQKENYSSNL